MPHEVTVGQVVWTHTTQQSWAIFQKNRLKIIYTGSENLISAHIFF